MSAQQPQREALPPQPTPFLGRQGELAALLGLLDDPACRLVTLTGPGGIGKTRLALEVAARAQGRFPDGVALASLQAVPSAAFLAAAVADALRVQLQGQGEPEARLLHALRDRRLLLVLDTFEHLLDGAGLLLALLRAAPEVTILVTSREALNLREEWRFPLDGLDLPGTDGGPPSSATELFAHCARRARRDFDPAAEGAAVARICRLVAGMPLAIELAATWTRTLPCAAIAAEIERDLAFLAAGLRDLPERHRSMRAVFDQSWRLLGPAEQAAFRRLAVFRGGFAPDAAAHVAGAPPPLLGALVDKSLIRLDAGGRYQLHELLRQYAAWRLGDGPAEAAAAQRAHADYYVNLLAEQGGRAFCGRAALDAIAGELENVRAAWAWAAAQRDLGALERAAHPLWAYYHQRGPVQEGLAAIERGLACLGDAGAAPLRAQLLVQRGWLLVRRGDLSGARATFEAGQALFAEGGLAPPPGYATDPTLGLARLALWAGRYGEAWRLAEEARRRSEAGGHAGNRAVARYIQAGAARVQGRLRTAQRLAHEALAAADRLGNDWVRAYCLEELGRIAEARGAHAQARAHLQACYELRVARGDGQGAAIAGALLGAVTLRLGAQTEAHEHYERSVAALRRLGNRDILVAALNGLGVAAAARGDHEAARRALAEACRTAVAIQYGAILPALLASAADLLLRLGRAEQAAELLPAVLRDAASADDTFALAQGLALACEAALAPELFAAAARRGRALDLDAAVALAQGELAAPVAAGPAPPAPRPPPDGPAEPLTPRELEVLRLIGDGLSNQAIADRLVLAHGTVRWYTQQIYGKLGVQSRTQALARARALRLLAE